MPEQYTPKISASLLVDVLGKEIYVDDIITSRDQKSGKIISRNKELIITSTRFGVEDVYLGKLSQLMTIEELICGALGIRIGRTEHNMNINPNSSVYDVIKQAHSLAYKYLIKALNSTNQKNRIKWGKMNPRTPLEERLSLTSDETTEEFLKQVTAPVKKYISWAHYMHMIDNHQSTKYIIGMKDIPHNRWTQKGGRKERPNYVIPNHAKKIARILNEFGNEYNPQIQKEIEEIKEAKRISKLPKPKPKQLDLFD